MIVTWVTQDPIDESTVEYGCDNNAVEAANGTRSSFTDGGFKKRVITIHRVLLTGLKPNKLYCK
jgi:hypothetical protein